MITSLIENNDYEFTQTEFCPVFPIQAQVEGLVAADFPVDYILTFTCYVYIFSIQCTCLIYI